MEIYCAEFIYIYKDLSKNKDVKGRACNPIYCQSWKLYDILEVASTIIEENL
jgi:hypothetical protein